MDAYIYQADLYCEDCAGDTMQPHDALDAGLDSDNLAICPYADGGGESDSPAHCGSCGVFLENPLTGDGAEYVKDAVLDGSGNTEVLAEWREYYDWIF